MNPLFKYNNLLSLFRLIGGYFIMEWASQLSFLKPPKSARWLSKEFLIQGAIFGMITYLLAGSWESAWLIPVIAVLRVTLEGSNSRLEKRNNEGLLFLSFLLKHFMYLLVLLGCWCVLVGVGISDIFEILTLITSNITLWVVGFSYIIVIWPAGLWIGNITAPWRNEMEKTSSQGLKKAGLMLGRLERVLILTFVFINHYEAIGLLIAAKSVFRFKDIKNVKDRKESEYILIGTLLSFVIAVLVGMIARWFLQEIKP